MLFMELSPDVIIQYGVFLNVYIFSLNLFLLNFLKGQYLLAFYMIVMIGLFSNFYVHEYIGKKKQRNMKIQNDDVSTKKFNGRKIVKNADHYHNGVHEINNNHIKMN
jgi:hypothetical protein